MSLTGHCEPARHHAYEALSRSGPVAQRGLHHTRRVGARLALIRNDADKSQIIVALKPSMGYAQLCMGMRLGNARYRQLREFTVLGMSASYL